MENQTKPTLTPGDIEAALRAAYRKSRSTGIHESIEGLPGWIVRLQTIHFSAWGKREVLELLSAAPEGKDQGTTINVGKGYIKPICRLLSEGVPAEGLLDMLLHVQKAPVEVLDEEEDGESLN